VRCVPTSAPPTSVYTRARAPLVQAAALFTQIYTRKCLSHQSLSVRVAGWDVAGVCLDIFSLEDSHSNFESLRKRPANMCSLATISSSSSEDDEARRAFAEVALQAERGLASGSRRISATNAPSARNPRIAEALDRIISGTLAFESVRGNENDENDENDEKGTPGERASASVGVGRDGRERRGEEVAGDHGGVRLFRKGPAVSKLHQTSKRRKEVSQRRYAVVPSRLPQRRLVDLDAVFGSKDGTSLRGIVVSGQHLIEELEMLKPETSGRRGESRVGQAPPQIGIVCRPPKRTKRTARPT